SRFSDGVSTLSSPLTVAGAAPVSHRLPFQSLAGTIAAKLTVAMLAVKGKRASRGLAEAVSAHLPFLHMKSLRMKSYRISIWISEAKKRQRDHPGVRKLWLRRRLGASRRTRLHHRTLAKPTF